MKKLMTIAVIATLAVGGLALGSSGGGSDRLQGSATSGTTERVRTQEDAEHRDRRVREAGEDVRGPCDEAEHANDPRCTGVAPAPRDDEDAEERHGDRSGPSENSGPGNARDDDRPDDASGHGNGDNSGPGSGDDSSGSGSGSNGGHGS